MITPRRTRLVRVPNLQAFRRAIVGLVLQGVRPLLVLVPTKSAAQQLSRSLEDADPADIVTRDELYDKLHARLAHRPQRLNALERDVMAQAAARRAWDAAGGDLPFNLRPGLVREMLRFYDQLRRQSQQVDRFEELIDQALASDSDLDRGARRMLAQTRFLSETFKDYEKQVSASGACDEHGLRGRLVAEAADDPIRHVVVTVPDWIADPDGLFVADFDLLARLPGLEQLDLVSTQAQLRSGFDERLHTWWPGLEEIVETVQPEPQSSPMLLAPSANEGHLYFTYRDREEELISVARRLPEDLGLERVGVAYKRPLPYLYLAAETLGAAGIPYQTSDALPLAAEPTAAAIDLALELVESGFTRDAIVALLRSPHFRFEDAAETPGSSAGAGSAAVTPESIGALDRALCQHRHLGDHAQLEALAAEVSATEAAPAFRAALAAAQELAPLAQRLPISTQIRRLLSFFNGRTRPLEDSDRFAAREWRARAAIVDVLTALAVAHETHDDPPAAIDDVSMAIRRWIEEQTFAAHQSSSGLWLMDDRAARYAELDDITVVGLIEGDWPERARRGIFYGPALLRALGWPSEKDRRAGADARFVDLLTSPSRQIALSTFTLDEDALVEPSTQLEEIGRAGLATVVGDVARLKPRATTPEPCATTLEPRATTPEPSEAARVWAEMRMARSPLDAPAFHGSAGEQPPRTWSVSALETYLGCPFQFFARHVLRLEEEPDDEEVMDPKAQGRFIHEVFEDFFREWQAAGGKTITPENLDRARETFASVVDRSVERLPAAEAALERTRLVGSPVAAGLGEAVLRMEAERPTAVVDRLLEHELNGNFVVTVGDRTRVVSLRGKADRLDLLRDGTFRLIDYKLGWPPNRALALQLPIYGLCAEQRLADEGGRHWSLGEAVYLAFKGPRRVVPLFSSPAEAAKVLADAQVRLVSTVDAIARGEFPPTPDDVYRCETCAFASVCRKDYVGDV